MKNVMVYENDTVHCISRAKERAGLSSHKAKRFIELARQRGIRSTDCRWSLDRKYLEEKSNERIEALAYNGFCFIMERDTKKCITIFKLPKRFGKKKTFYSSNNDEIVICDLKCY